MSGLVAFVTGAPGWLGTRFVQSLLEGIDGLPPAAERVVCFVHPSVNPAALTFLGKRVEVVAGDIGDPKALDGFLAGAEGAVLYHLVGLIHPRRIRELYEVNTEGTRNAIDAAVRARVKRVVVVSSNSPAGCNASPEERFTEESPFHPYMNYGRSKMLAEQYTNEVGASGRIETVILRPCWFYGPGQPPRQTTFFTMIREGKAPIVGDGECRRSMSYVDNTCQALLLAGNVEGARGRTYWIADEEPYTMNQIVDTVERLLEKDFGFVVAKKRMRLPGIASSVAYGVDGILQGLGLYHQKIHVLSEMNKTIACSVDRARRELGYRPRVALEEGMRRSIRWCLDQGHVI